jgi:aminopeptidase N
MLSINRGFSAPVIVEVERGPDELEQLAAQDSDPFARFEAMQELMMRALVAGARCEQMDRDPIIRAVGSTLASPSLDIAFKGEAVFVPSENIIGDRMEVVDPDAVHQSRDTLRAALGSALRDDLMRVRSGSAPSGDDLSPEAKGARRLRGVALGLLAAGDPREGAALAKAQFDAADNMTDRQGALAILVSLDEPERQQALDAFYERFRDDPLVIDKWFALQALAQRRGTIDEVERLAAHPAFNIANPNRLRALAGNFAANPWVFNDASGRGYRFVADMTLAADKLNPQVAARLVAPFGRWRRMEPGRSALMRAELERIAATPGLSKDVFEQASKSLS